MVQILIPSPFIFSFQTVFCFRSLLASLYSQNYNINNNTHCKQINRITFIIGMLKVENFFLNTRNFSPGTRREFSTTWWWCHTRDPELPMRPRLLMRSCALPSCKFAASRLNIKRHYAQLQQRAFDVHCISLSREHTKNVKLRLEMLNELEIYIRIRNFNLRYSCQICARTDVGIEVSANKTRCLCSLPAVDARRFTSRLPWPPATLLVSDYPSCPTPYL